MPYTKQELENGNVDFTGVISGDGAGGICGAFTGYSGNVGIYNCYTLGDISGAGAGGICGGSFGSNSGTPKIYNCYSIIVYFTCYCYV